MTIYHRKPTEAQAWQFQRQPKAEWPAFVTEYEVLTNMGPQRPGLSGVGTLLLPVRSAVNLTANPGDWVVKENGVLTVMRPAEFEALFEAFGVSQVETAAAPDTPAPAVEPAPETPGLAGGTAPEAKLEKPGRAGAKAAAATSEEPPAAAEEPAADEA